MANRFVLLFLFFISIGAHAGTSSRWYQVAPYPNESTMEAACNDFLAANPTYIFVSITTPSPPYGRCNYKSQPTGSVLSKDIGTATRECPDGQDVVLPSAGYPSCGEVAPPPTCSYGEYLQDGACVPIVCPVGTHYGRDPEQQGVEVNRCIDDCPINTVSNIDAVTHIQVCAPPDPKIPDTSPSGTCPADRVQVGFDGSGKALCMLAPGKDPCPRGTHNISTVENEPNCTTNSPSPEQTVTETKHPESTTTNPDGSTVKTNQTETTFPDGSTQTTTTTTITTSNGTSTTSTTTQCSREGACGASGGGGGAGNGSGDGDGDDSPDNPVAPTGDLYTKKDKTFAGVFQNFTTTLQAAPFISGAQNFLSVSVGGGACPSWSATIPYLETVVDAGQYVCSGAMSDALQVIGIGLMIAAAFAAFKWGFL